MLHAGRAAQPAGAAGRAAEVSPASSCAADAAGDGPLAAALLELGADPSAAGALEPLRGRPAAAVLLDGAEMRRTAQPRSRRIPGVRYATRWAEACECAGALAQLQRALGAPFWVSRASDPDCCTDAAAAVGLGETLAAEPPAAGAPGPALVPAASAAAARRPATLLLLAGGPVDPGELREAAAAGRRGGVERVHLALCAEGGEADGPLAVLAGATPGLRLLRCFRAEREERLRSGALRRFSRADWAVLVLTGCGGAAAPPAAAEALPARRCSGKAAGDAAARLARAAAAAHAAAEMADRDSAEAGGGDRRGRCIAAYLSPARLDAPCAQCAPALALGAAARLGARAAPPSPPPSPPLRQHGGASSARRLQCWTELAAALGAARSAAAPVEWAASPPRARAGPSPEPASPPQRDAGGFGAAAAERLRRLDAQLSELRSELGCTSPPDGPRSPARAPAAPAAAPPAPQPARTPRGSPAAAPAPRRGSAASGCSSLGGSCSSRGTARYSPAGSVHQRLFADAADRRSRQLGRKGGGARVRHDASG
eukprot:TRINITY_DN25290_c0_g1_i1.p2 TRINITY_DN25290_c0_g1~~TRINITY_DN25290_c0_g1_i1.p2  ORF type:complete len:543 (+),score=136.54 TRINITY_DN25290_c0_g1_i1:81-1709(+)